MSPVANVLSLAVGWFVTFSTFLMSVQLGQTYHQRDLVDHAASVAADAVSKTLCADAKDYGVPEGDYRNGRERAVRGAVEPLLSLMANRDGCTVHVKRSGASEDPGRIETDVTVTCELPCHVPLAAQVLCSGSPSHVTFAATQKAVAHGCDAGRSSS